MSLWLPPHLSVRRVADRVRLGTIPPLAWDVEVSHDEAIVRRCAVSRRITLTAPQQVCAGLLLKSPQCSYGFLEPAAVRQVIADRGFLANLLQFVPCII